MDDQYFLFGRGMKISSLSMMPLSMVIVVYLLL